MTRNTETTIWLLPITLIVSGCASWLSPAPKSHPYFLVDQSETKTITAMGKKQDAVLAKCAEHSSCDHAYFTRALIGLYESRDTAIKYFEKVLIVSPKGKLAASSRTWLELLQQPAPNDRSWFTSVMAAPEISESQVTLGQASDRLVRDLLDRELMLQQLRTTKESDAQTIELLRRELADRDRKVEVLSERKDSPKPAPDMASVQAIQKQLAERDKKIEELSSQLEALKRIDQEMREKVRPVRPPSTTVPPAPSEPANP